MNKIINSLLELYPFAAICESIKKEEIIEYKIEESIYKFNHSTLFFVVHDQKKIPLYIYYGEHRFKDNEEETKPLAVIPNAGIDKVLGIIDIESGEIVFNGKSVLINACNGIKDAAIHFYKNEIIHRDKHIEYSKTVINGAQDHLGHYLLSELEAILCLLKKAEDSNKKISVIEIDNNIFSLTHLKKIDKYSDTIKTLGTTIANRITPDFLNTYKLNPIAPATTTLSAKKSSLELVRDYNLDLQTGSNLKNYRPLNISGTKNIYFEIRTNNRILLNQLDLATSILKLSSKQNKSIKIVIAGWPLTNISDIPFVESDFKTYRVFQKQLLELELPENSIEPLIGTSFSYKVLRACQCDYFISQVTTSSLIPYGIAQLPGTVHANEIFSKRIVDNKDTMIQSNNEINIIDNVNIQSNKANSSRSHYSIIDVDTCASDIISHIFKT